MRFFWVVTWLALSAPAFAACDAALPAADALRGAQSVADYQPALKSCQGEGGRRVAIRQMRLDSEPALLLADPETLETRVERAACWTCADTDEAALGDTRMMQAIVRAARAPGLSHRGFLDNAGLKHGHDGGYLTADLCPSLRPLDRAFLAGLSPGTPVGLSISGLWLTHHFADYRWLLARQAEGKLAITWINHSYSHPYHPSANPAENFLLSPGVDADQEILRVERLLIANGGTPSLFFRFPGLVSSSLLMQAVRRNHLIALGADAWLALNQKPHDGAIILVHANGNEERGLEIYRREASHGAIPMPLRPIDDAP